MHLHIQNSNSMDKHDKHVLLQNNFSETFVCILKNPQSLLSPTYMWISILLSTRLSKCLTFKRSTFVMSYTAATSASEMQIDDWEVQIRQASLFRNLLQIHLAEASEKGKIVKASHETNTKDGTATKLCWQCAKWCLTLDICPLAFFFQLSSARRISVQSYAMEHSVVKLESIEIENAGVTWLDMGDWFVDHQLQDHSLTLQPVTAGKSRFKPQLYEVVFPEALRQKRLWNIRSFDTNRKKQKKLRCWGGSSQPKTT